MEMMVNAGVGSGGLSTFISSAPYGKRSLTPFISMLLSLFLLVFPWVNGSAYAACSSYQGRVVINEYNYIQNWIELKVLDPLLTSGGVNPFDKVKLVIWAKQGGSMVKKKEVTVGSNYTDIAKNTCNSSLNTTYIQNPFAPSDMGDDVIVVLWKTDEGSKGSVIDVFRLGQASLAAYPASINSGYSQYDQCSSIESVLPNSYYDAPLTGNSGNKDIARLPDGTGPWTISPGTGANSQDSLCGSNDALFPLTKTPSSSSVGVGSGSPFIWTVTVKNGGASGSLSNVTVSDTLPANMFLSSCPAGATCAGSAGAYTYFSKNVGTLAPGVSATITATAYVTAAGTYTNTVKSTADELAPGYTLATGTVATTVGPHHYELSLPATSIACLATTATVTACKDANTPCTKDPSVSGKTALLAANAGVLGVAPVTFDATGVAGTTLSYPAAPDGASVVVTLSGEQVTALNPRKCCPDGVNCVVADSCSTIFNTAGFIFSATVNGGIETIPTQVAGTSDGTHYLRAVKTLDNSSHTCGAAFTGAQTVNLAYECNNPTTCYSSNLLSVNGGAATTIARNDNASVTSYTPVGMTFDANGNAPFTFVYGDAGQITLHARKTLTADATKTPPVVATTLTGTSNAFVVKPAGFVLSNIRQTASPNLINPAAADAAGAKFVKAGEAFSATVTAVTSTGSTAYNYGKEISPEGVKLSNALAPGLGLTNNPTLTNNTAFGSFTNGVATGTAFGWDEVGIITLTPSVGDADYLGVGDVTGTNSGNVGRFYPDHFGLTGSVQTRSDLLPATGSVFTYMDEPMRTTLTLTAYGKSSESLALANYAGNFAKLDATTLGTGSNWFNTGCAAGTQCMGLGAVDGSTGLSGRLSIVGGGIYSGIANPASSWSAGVGTFTADMKLSRGTTPDGIFKALKVGAMPQDSDGVTAPGTASADAAHKADLDASTGNTLASNPDGTNERRLLFTTDVRFGRLRLFNAFGSEKQDLQIPVQAQYWSGLSWVLNSADSLTALPSASFALSGTLSGSTSASAVLMSGGNGMLTMTKPNAVGYVDVAANLGLTGNDQSCLASHGGTPAVMPWLRARNGCASTYDRDPSARATFGIYAPETKKTIHVRELY